MKTRLWPTTQAHITSNVHPNYRGLWLAHIRQVRRMAREGRYTVDAARVIKQAQRSMLAARRSLAAASALPVQRDREWNPPIFWA